MRRSKLLRWFVRMIWLAVVVIGYRSLVDFGPQGSSGYNMHLLVLFTIFAGGDALLEWLWPDGRDAGAPGVA